MAAAAVGRDNAGMSDATFEDIQRRRRIGEAIVRGYLAVPPDAGDKAEAEAAAIAMINAEPW